MSLLAFSFKDRWNRPSQIVNQHFGLGLDPEDLLTPWTTLSSSSRCPSAYTRPWRSLASDKDSGSTVIADKDKLQMNLDVQQFAPNEITVKATGDVITVEGKHEEKQDKHGFITRHFVRRYVLPKGHDISKVQSRLSSDGVLSIIAPRTNPEAEVHLDIPIQHTGQPSKPVEAKKDKQLED